MEKDIKDIKDIKDNDNKIATDNQTELMTMKDYLMESLKKIRIYLLERINDLRSYSFFDLLYKKKQYFVTFGFIFATLASSIIFIIGIMYNVHLNIILIRMFLFSILFFILGIICALFFNYLFPEFFEKQNDYDEVQVDLIIKDEPDIHSSALNNRMKTIQNDNENYLDEILNIRSKTAQKDNKEEAKPTRLKSMEDPKILAQAIRSFLKNNDE